MMLYSLPFAFGPRWLDESAVPNGRVRDNAWVGKSPTRPEPPSSPISLSDVPDTGSESSNRLDAPEQLSRLRTAAASDPDMIELLQGSVIHRNDLVVALHTVARNDPLGRFLHLGTWGSGSPDRRAKELVKALPGMPINPWTGMPFSKQVLAVGALAETTFHVADPLLVEYIDLFWAVVFPYEWLRAEALQRFYEASLPPRMLNSLRVKIRDNALKNGEGPALRSWVIEQLGTPPDLIALVNTGIDPRPLDGPLAGQVRGSLSALRACLQYRDADLDLVETWLPAPAPPTAPVASRVRPELLDDLDAYLDGPQVPGAPAPRPLSEWGPRFQRVAVAALRTKHGRTMAGLAELAEDAWLVAQARLMTIIPPHRWPAGAQEPSVTFDSLLAHQGVWRALDEVLPQRGEVLFGPNGNGYDPLTDRRSPAGLDADGDERAEGRRSLAPLDIATLADRASADGAGDDVRETANGKVLREVLATLEEFYAAQTASDPKQLRKDLVRRIGRVADELRQAGRLRGRISREAICGLVELHYRSAAQRRPDVDEESHEEPIGMHEVRYVCDLGHVQAVTLLAGVEVPVTWDCRRCGRQARWESDHA